MKPRLVIYFLFPVIVIGFVINAFSRPATEKPRAVKVAELGTDGGELYSAYLDDLAARLQQDPTAKGLVIAYGPEGERSGTGKYIMYKCRDYLERRVEPKRIITIYGGPAKSPTEVGMEYWYLPAGAERPRPAVNQITTFSGPVGNGVRVEGTTLDFDECCGPSPGLVVMAGLAEILRHQPDHIGYVVTYQSGEDAPGAWRRVADYNIDLLKGYGIGSDRIKVVYGGADKSLSAHFWVLPKGEPLPIKEATPSRLGDKAMIVQQYDEDQLADSKAEQLAFKAIADLLKEYPDAKVCYMIMPPPSPPDASDDDDEEVPTAADEQDETPKADFHQIVEKWRTKLISDLKISPDRIVILYPSAVEEAYQGKMLSWIVPKNAVLPSPPTTEEIPDDDDPPIHNR